MISLGCAKNLVDAEIMLGSVLQRGMEITSSADEADVLVVNTCAFIDSAKQESIDAILTAHHTMIAPLHAAPRPGHETPLEPRPVPRFAATCSRHSEAGRAARGVLQR